MVTHASAHTAIVSPSGQGINLNKLKLQIPSCCAIALTAAARLGLALAYVTSTSLKPVAETSFLRPKVLYLCCSKKAVLTPDKIIATALVGLKLLDQRALLSTFPESESPLNLLRQQGG